MPTVNCWQSNCIHDVGQDALESFTITEDSSRTQRGPRTRVILL